MTEHEDESGQPASDSAARFHFDPNHNHNGAPPLKDVISWLRHRMNDDATSGLGHAFRLSQKLGQPRSLAGHLKSLMPRVKQENIRKAADQCIEWAMPQITIVHDTMREFGIDLRGHKFAKTIQSMISIAMLDRAIETAAQHMKPEDRPPADPITTEDRLSSRWDVLRKELEAEALVNLVESPELTADWPRMVAAMRASRDEISTPEIQDSMAKVADRIERALSGQTRS